MNDSSLTIRSIIPITADFLRQKGIGSGRLDAEVLLGHVLGMSRVELYVNFDQPLEDAEVDAYRTAVRSRGKRVPVAYIIGSKEFMSLDFSVGPGVLVPRPDTEILVEALVRRLSDASDIVVADIGTGTGAIAVAVAIARPRALVYAVDSSPDALRYCEQNVEKHGLAGRVVPLLGDLLAPLSNLALDRSVDAVVSNPPYIATAAISGLEAEVSVHEPRLALDGGTDGLRFYRELVPQSSRVLRPGGCLAFEVGEGQSAAVVQTIRSALPGASTCVESDYAGVERVVLAIRGEDSSA